MDKEADNLRYPEKSNQLCFSRCSQRVGFRFRVFKMDDFFFNLKGSSKNL